MRFLQPRFKNPIVLIAFGVGGLGFVTMLAGLAFSVLSDVRNIPVSFRFVIGGACLFLAGLTGVAFYVLIATGKTPYWPSLWSCRYEFRHRRVDPARFWFYTVLFPVLTLGMLVLSLLGFLGYWP